MVNALLSVVVYFPLQWHRVTVSSRVCVSRQGNDRSAVHQLDTDRAGRRAGGGGAISGAGLAGFRSARSGDAPAAIVQALSLDQASVALPVLEHSPLLIDADLVDIIATGNGEMQCAIARRLHLPPSVCAAIAEVGTAAAAPELIGNAYAELAPFSWDR